MSSRIFSLQGRGLKLDTRADIEPYLKDVPTTIEEIHLGGNTIGVEAAQALAEFLSKTTALKVADFADIFTGRLISEIPQALSAICDALVPKTTLVEIDLSDNAFGGRSVDPMVPFLSQNRSFQILKLNNNGLGPAGGAIVAEALLRSAELSAKAGAPSQLRTVICGRNRLEDGAAPTWAKALAAHGGLTEVRMPQNGIRMAGAAALAHGLTSCAGLTHLDLQDNTFGEEGASAMAAALRAWPALRHLNLSDCVLAEEGAVSPVLEALAGGSNPKLEVLQLQNNNLDTQSFALLAEGLEVHLPLLKMLEMQWNEIEEDDEGIATLLGLLKKRGGKLVLDDEEEEEEEEEAEEDELEKLTAAPEDALDKEADELADALSKVEIKS
ncbi:RNI-like protein [Wolfiporia cocos MD-104 SS10]|uniref:RNI-like protein n=1 Tax=Wolfiporia cocos (strain MD-104) TaxID=742152 RepID=A0A2H3JT55_WOLCO|nr:RNI-like protein [Wolfiporia cocos MD-104 SS10]